MDNTTKVYTVVQNFDLWTAVIYPYNTRQYPNRRVTHCTPTELNTLLAALTRRAWGLIWKPNKKGANPPNPIPWRNGYA